MFSKMPRAAFQWIALGAVQYFATARTAFEMSGRIDIDSHIKVRSNSRIGHWDVNALDHSRVKGSRKFGNISGEIPNMGLSKLL